MRHRFIGAGCHALKLPELGQGWRRLSTGFVAVLLTVVMVRASGDAMPAGGGVVNAAVSGTMAPHLTGEQCIRCHKVEAGFSHPVDMVPTMTIPAGLPLENGRVTCLTCHEDTPEAHTQSRKGEHPGSMLRMGLDETVLCGECHVAEGITRQSMHPMDTGKATLM